MEKKHVKGQNSGLVSFFMNSAQINRGKARTTHKITKSQSVLCELTIARSVARIPYQNSLQKPV